MASKLNCSTSNDTARKSGELHNSGTIEDLQAVMEQKKRKRLISNRESARRSRMRKLKQLDDLMEETKELSQKKSELTTAITLTTTHYLSIEAENCVLRTRVAELTSRLDSLNNILYCLNSIGGDMSFDSDYYFTQFNGVSTSYSPSLMIDSPLNHYMNQTVMASAADTMFQC